MPPIPANRTPENMKAYYQQMAQHCRKLAVKAWTDEQQAQWEKEASSYESKANSI